MGEHCGICWCTFRLIWRSVKCELSSPLGNALAAPPTGALCSLWFPSEDIGFGCDVWLCLADHASAHPHPEESSDGWQKEMRNLKREADDLLYIASLDMIP